MQKEPAETICDKRIESYEERRKQIQKFNLTSDIFFCKVLEDKEACQEVAGILLKNPGLVIKEVKAQYSIRNIVNRSVVLDILAEDIDGKLLNIEMQVADDEDHQKRVRYCAASMDMSFLEKGVPYEKLPDIHLIFITKRDFLNQGSGIYYIVRTIEGNGTILNNGIHEVYANLTHKCDDEKINELLEYMKKADSDYKTDVFPNVVRNVKFLKEQKEGVTIMCDILEKEREEGKVEGKAEGEKAGTKRYSQLILKLIADGRQEDIPKAAADSTVLQELYKEYQI